MIMGPVRPQPKTPHPTPNPSVDDRHKQLFIIGLVISIGSGHGFVSLGTMPWSGPRNVLYLQVYNMKSHHSISYLGPITSL